MGWAVSRHCLYFGTFNPIHTGHLMIAQAVLNQAPLGVNRVLFLPAGSPPHRNGENDLASAQHRLTMARLAVAGNPAFSVSDVEVRKPGKSYTVETIEMLIAEGMEAPVPVIIGSDALSKLETWRRPADLAKQVCFLQMQRPGIPFVTTLKYGTSLLTLNTQAIEMPELALSSSWVRAWVKQNRGNCAGLRYFLPETVRMYIQDNGLYV